MLDKLFKGVMIFDLYVCPYLSTYVCAYVWICVYLFDGHRYRCC